MAPKISFIIPIYNGEKFIARCVSSVIDQGLPLNDFEIIIINDGSTDDSLSVVQELQKKHAAIRIINQDNQGVAVARNVGIDAAVGEYLWFVDNDDVLIRNSARHLLAHVMQNNLDVLTFGVKELPAGAGLTNHDFIQESGLSQVATGRAYVAQVNYYNTAWHYLVQRRLLMEANIRFPSGRWLAEDAIFTPTVFLAAQRMAHCDGIAYVWIRHSTSVTKRRDAETMKRACDGLFGAIGDFQCLIAAHKGGSPGLVSRLKSRKDSYTLFLCLRLLISDQSLRYVTRMYRELRLRGHVPIIHLSETEYPGVKYFFLRTTVNTQALFLLAAILTRLAGFVRAPFTNK